MTKIKIFNVGSYRDGAWIENSLSVDTIEEADIITFPGGLDINPALYGDVIGKYTYFYDHVDRRELSAFNNPNAKGKLLVGICRGAQFLTAMSGGRLVQDFRGHNGGHDVIIGDNLENVINVNSLHHQMMYPFEMDPKDYHIIGRAWQTTGRNFIDGHNQPMQMPYSSLGDIIEPEIVYYPKTRSLCFQFHPEMMGYDKRYARTLNLCNHLVLEYLNIK